MQMSMVLLKQERSTPQSTGELLPTDQHSPRVSHSLSLAVTSSKNHNQYHPSPLPFPSGTSQNRAEAFSTPKETNPSIPR